MQRLPKQIALAELAGAPVDLYTVPANTKTTISACSVTNKSAEARTVTVLARQGGGAARHLAYKLGVAAGETRIVHGALAQTLETGGVLSAHGDVGGSLDIVVSAYETNP